MATELDPWAAAQTAIIAALEDVGIRCLDYDGPSLGTLPVATLTPEGALPAELATDQGFLIGEIVFNLRYYTRMDEAPKHAWVKNRAGVTLIYSALGGSLNLTLSGAVRSLDLLGTRFDTVRVLDGGQLQRPEVMSETQLLVRPRPYTLA